MKQTTPKSKALQMASKMKPQLQVTKPSLQVTKPTLQVTPRIPYQGGPLA